MTDALAKLQGLRRELKTYFIEREEIVDGALAGLLSGEHVLFIGPVGTAKSMLARSICERIEGASFFGWLLTKFSTPEELFGPISLKGLERDEFRRIVIDKLPTAEIAFLDEIFKANSAILNSLLAILNERVYHNGTSAESVPLLTLFGASNELPEEGELMALYDRFLLRFQLDYVVDDESFIRLLGLDDEPPRTNRLTLDELRLLQQQTKEVHVPAALLRDLSALRTALNEMSVEASDRRYKKSLDVLRAYAVLAERDTVQTTDLTHLQHILWSEPSEQSDVAAKIEEVTRRFDLAAQDLQAKAQQQRDYATRFWSSHDERVAASVESLAKLKRLLGQSDALIEEARGRDDDSAARLQSVRAGIAEIIDTLLHATGDGQRQ